MTVLKIFFSTLFLGFSVCAETLEQLTVNNQSAANLAENKARSTQLVMIDFTQQQERFNWRISNDGVMGGESQGNIIFEQDHGVFTGNISLANNGGFSSAFRGVEPLSKEINVVTVDIAGDGHLYQLRMATKINGERIYYFHEFNTVKGQRQKLRFELVDFQATFRGKKVTNAPTLKAESISEVGFLLTTKQAGAFSLSVFAIDFIK